VSNLIKIDSAADALHMREKTGYHVDFFFVNVYPFFATPTGHIFSVILTLNGSYEVSATISAFTDSR